MNEVKLRSSFATGSFWTAGRSGATASAAASLFFSFLLTFFFLFLALLEAMVCGLGLEVKSK